MDYVKELANPIGKAFVDDNIDNFVKTMSAEWDKNKEEIPWWAFWRRISFTRVTNFLLSVLDDLIAYVDDVIDNGPDKKATVLNAIERLYDYIVVQALPIWMKPFAGSIKSYVINEVVSPAIDWIVDKYRNGEWRKKTAPELAAQWAKMGHTAGVLPKA